MKMLSHSNNPFAAFAYREDPRHGSLRRFLSGIIFNGITQANKIHPDPSPLPKPKPSPSPPPVVQQQVPKPTPKPSPSDKQPPAKKGRRTAKKKIPAAMRVVVWDQYKVPVSQDGTKKCYCCEIVDITPFNFECGHVVAEAKGGVTAPSNLRPICGLCNRSMATKDMEDFKKLLKS
jgi:outer membrane biosynthesis protein TonB